MRKILRKILGKFKAIKIERQNVEYLNAEHSDMEVELFARIEKIESLERELKASLKENKLLIKELDVLKARDDLLNGMEREGDRIASLLL